MTSREFGPTTPPKIDFKEVDVNDTEALRRVAELEVQAFGLNETVDTLKEVISRGVIIGVIYENGKIVGCGQAAINADPEETQSLIKNLPQESICSFAAIVDPEFRGRGLQKILLEKRKSIPFDMGNRFDTASRTEK